MKPFISTLTGWYLRPAWVAKVDTLDRRTMSRWEFFRRIVAASRRYEGMILNGSIGMNERYVDLLAAVAVRRSQRRPPPIVITDCSWRLGDASIDRTAMRAGIRALDGPRIRFCVRSTAELELFPATWGVDPSHVVFTPYAHTATDEELAVPSSREGPIFAGGNSLRDYATLLEATRGLGAGVHIATSRIDADGSLPPGVTVSPIRSHDAFVDAMRRASVVVTPLEPGLRRAAGLDTYLTAMALGKPVIVTDGPGVRDYVEDGRTGLVTPSGDPDALRRAMEWMVDPRNADEIDAMATRAADVARTRLTYDRYVEKVLSVLESLIDPAP